MGAFPLLKAGLVTALATPPTAGLLDLDYPRVTENLGPASRGLKCSQTAKRTSYAMTVSREEQ